MDPDDTCESTGLTYSNFAGDFINSNCGNAGCHAAGSAFTFEMHNYETTKTAVDLGRIIGAINHDEGFSAMPQGQSQLSECNIEKLTTWIQDGAPE